MINTFYIIGKSIRQSYVKYNKIQFNKINYRFSDHLEKINGLSISEYKNLTNGFLEDLSETIENLQNQNIEDVELTEGVLKIFSKSSKTFVINRQTPNRQLWYSSPISGPQRFSYNVQQKQWMNSQNKNIQELLIEELNKIK